MLKRIDKVKNQKKQSTREHVERRAEFLRKKEKQKEKKQMLRKKWLTPDEVEP